MSAIRASTRAQVLMILPLSPLLALRNTRRRLHQLLLGQSRRPLPASLPDTLGHPWRRPGDRLRLRRPTMTTSMIHSTTPLLNMDCLLRRLCHMGDQRPLRLLSRNSHQSMTMMICMNLQCKAHQLRASLRYNVKNDLRLFLHQARHRCRRRPPREASVHLWI